MGLSGRPNLGFPCWLFWLDSFSSCEDWLTLLEPGWFETLSMQLVNLQHASFPANTSTKSEWEQERKEERKKGHSLKRIPYLWQECCIQLESNTHQSVRSGEKRRGENERKKERKRERPLGWLTSSNNLLKHKFSRVFVWIETWLRSIEEDGRQPEEILILSFLSIKHNERVVGSPNTNELDWCVPPSQVLSTTQLGRRFVRCSVSFATNKCFVFIKRSNEKNQRKMNGGRGRLGLSWRVNTTMSHSIPLIWPHTTVHVLYIHTRPFIHIWQRYAVEFIRTDLRPEWHVFELCGTKSTRTPDI